MTNYALFENLNDLVAVQTDSITSHTFHKGDDLRGVLFAFDADQELTEHTSPYAAVVHILSGRARLTLGEDVHTLSEGAWLYMPPHLAHSVYAETPLKMLLLLLGE